jgi:pyruvate kinase
MNIARLNLAHGIPDIHAQYIDLIRTLSQRLGKRVAILLDLPGPKYRTGNLQNGQVMLKKSCQVVITTREVTGDTTLIPVNVPSFSQTVRPGDNILLDDGAIQLRVLATAGTEVKCQVIVGGRLTPGRGLVIPGRVLAAPFISDSLRQHIHFAINQQPDYLAISFVSSDNDILSIRSLLQDNDADIPIIAKIERGQAVAGFNHILAVSDGVMVARGDLGVDIPLERVPLVQKEIIGKCNRAGKPVITATQMLESMVHATRPTRAEVTDVANAILDGTDATMLSAETSIGEYPVAAVRTMARIAHETERKLPYQELITEKKRWLEEETDELISYSACQIADSLRAIAIVAFTQSGSTARRVSKYRPRVPILAITPDDTVSGRLMLHWGVHPFTIGQVSSLTALFALGTSLTRDLRLAKAGDLVVITGGVPIGIPGSTNLLKVDRITEAPPLVTTSDLQ